MAWRDAVARSTSGPAPVWSAPVLQHVCSYKSNTANHHPLLTGQSPQVQYTPQLKRSSSNGCQQVHMRNTPLFNSSDSAGKKENEPPNCQSPQVQSRNSASGQSEKHEPPQVQRRNTSLQNRSVGETRALQQQPRNTNLLKGSVSACPVTRHLNIQSPHILIK